MSVKIRIHWRKINFVGTAFVDIREVYLAAHQPKGQFLSWFEAEKKAADLQIGEEWGIDTRMTNLVELEAAFEIMDECKWFTKDPETVLVDRESTEPSYILVYPREQSPEYRVVGARVTKRAEPQPAPVIRAPAATPAIVRSVPAVISPPGLSDGIIGSEHVKTVNARDLHDYLEVLERFDGWIKTRIEEYDFNIGIDYCLSGSDYFVSIDMAKQLAMAEKNAKGTETRRYYISCEKQLRKIESAPAPDLSNPAVLRGLLSTYSDKVDHLEQKVALAAPAVAFHEAYVMCDKDHGLQDASRAFGLRPNDLPRILRDRGHLFKQKGKNVPYAPRLERGYFVVKLADPENDRSTNTYITPKGMEWIGRNLLKWQDGAPSSEAA
jgi:anti-repressor protein